MLRAACWIWAGVLILIMWLPEPQFARFELTSPSLEGLAFAVGAVLFALADRSRPRVFRPRPDAQKAIAYLVLGFKRHLVRVTLMLIGYAAVLEVGQIFVPGREFYAFELGENTLSILLASVLVYAVARLFLANRHLFRITERHLGNMAESYRAEARYSRYLRDVIQASRSICLSPSLSAAAKIDRIGRLLDDALGIEIPNPEEDLLDTAFGERKVEPAAFRPSAEKV